MTYIDHRKKLGTSTVEREMKVAQAAARRDIESH